MISSLFKLAKLRGLRPFRRYHIGRSFSSTADDDRHHWSNSSYVHGVPASGSLQLRPYTIGGIFDDAVRRSPDSEYLISRHEGKRYTFAAMDTEVDRLCRSFAAIGLKLGDRIGVWMPNCALYFSMVIATARLGLILVNINPAYRSDEVKYSLTLAGVKCLVTLETFKTQNYQEILEQVDPDIWNRPTGTKIKSKVLPMLETVVFDSENHINGAYNLISFLDLGSNSNFDIPNVQPDAGWNIQFTSGTTGKPKAAVLNHLQLINNTYSVIKRIGILDDIDKGIPHKYCCTMPLFHVFALAAGLIAPILTRSTVLLPSAHFDPKATVNVITEEKCTFFFGTPTIYVDVISAYEELPAHRQDNDMKLAIVGGAPCSPSLMKDFKAMFPAVKLGSLFGMTESGPSTFQNLIDDTDEQLLTTVGCIQDNVEAKVVDANGNIVPFGTAGELLIRGYLNMEGYFNDKMKTDEMIDSNRWLHTGDQFVLYEGGYGNYVGRLKDMIIRGGENIFPKEIEYFLESHPLIIQAQVYGVPDRRMGEEVCASVVVKEGETLTETDVKAFCKGKIAHFKIPKHVFIEKDKLPKTGSGKVQKYKLKELAIQRIANTLGARQS